MNSNKLTEIVFFGKILIIFAYKHFIDVTQMIIMNRAHPDDIELGCGGVQLKETLPHTYYDISDVTHVHNSTSGPQGI
jgi:hypothetical protein